MKKRREPLGPLTYTFLSAFNKEMVKLQVKEIQADHQVVMDWY